MTKLNDFFMVRELNEDAGSISCIILYNVAHDIFKGHFPENPIVPGVCTMQMVMDLLQKAVQKKLRLLHAPNVKFLQLITPDMAPAAHITWIISENAYSANATLKDGEVTLFKMNGTYIVQD